MSDIHKQLDINIIPNSRYKILSENNEWKFFKGIAKGESSSYLYEVDGHLYTEDHTFIINNNKVKAKDIGLITNKLQEVFEPLDVIDTHNYLADNKLHENCLILDEFA